MMYKRKENIKEETLDWVKHPVSPFGKQGIKTVKAVHPPVPNHSEASLNESIVLEKKSNIKRKTTDLLDKNSKLFLIFSISIFPYIVGFLVSYFLFYFYSAISIGSFLSLQQGYRHIELWGIGVYLFVTFGIIWIVLKSLLKKD